MGRHYNKAELLSMVAQAKKEKEKSINRDIFVYATYANLVTYFLYKTCKWEPERLVKYLEINREYYDKYIEDPNQWYEQKDRLFDFMGDHMWNWTDDVVFTEPAHISCNKVINQLNMYITEVNNEYMEETERFYLSHYNAMIDMGLTREELYMHYELLDELRVRYAKGSAGVIYMMHEELVDELGIDIKIPTADDCRKSSTKNVV